MNRKAGLRWLLVVVVLVAACVVALWPRTSDSEADQRENRPAAPVRTTQPSATSAKLPECPKFGNGTVAQLRGVHVRCLGDGSDVELGSALAGQTTLVNVWAPWCAPCRDELPKLAEYAKKPGAARVLLLQVQSDPEQGREMLDELGVRLPAVHDSGAADKALRVPFGLPASYVVDPRGKVRFVEQPRVFTELGEIDRAIERYGRADG